jgi:uncharacterized Zn finger protein
MGWYGYKPYVSAAERKAKALKQMEKLRKQGQSIKPIVIAGRKIAKNFWGEAWCEHLESFSDYANRLPRGRTYVRNGSVCHLDIEKGEVSATVSGSELYQVKVSINPLPPAKWNAVKKSSTNQIRSLLDLLQGKIPDSVMETVTNQQNGLFPSPREIKFDCSCPDYASMCKHIAAVLYGVGARLDQNPELLFTLRGVAVEELIDKDAEVATATGGRSSKRNRISLEGLGDVFDIEINDDEAGEAPVPGRNRVHAAPKDPAREQSEDLASSATITRKVAAKKKVPLREKVLVSRNSSPEPVTGKEVKELRQKFEMSQAKFGKLIGVSATMICFWENGKLGIKEEYAQSLRQALKHTKKKAWEKTGLD